MVIKFPFIKQKEKDLSLVNKDGNLVVINSYCYPFLISKDSTDGFICLVNLETGNSEKTKFKEVEKLLKTLRKYDDIAVTRRKLFF